MNDPNRPPRRPSEDPLAELARLIGQEDPFADFASKQRKEEGDRRTREAMDEIERVLEEGRRKREEEDLPRFLLEAKLRRRTQARLDRLLDIGKTPSD